MTSMLAWTSRSCKDTTFSRELTYRCCVDYGFGLDDTAELVVFFQVGDGCGRGGDVIERATWLLHASRQWSHRCPS